MMDQELRHLTREDLLDIIYELQRRTQQVEQENETIRKQLADRTVKLEKAGSIAEAALALNGVFEGRRRQQISIWHRSMRQTNSRSSLPTGSWQMRSARQPPLCSRHSRRQTASAP